MKTVVAMLLASAALACAQEAKTEEPKNTEVKRLASVTWNLATHKLEWTVEKGSIVDGEFVAAKKVSYEVSPDEAFMAYAGEKRAIDGEEGAALHHVLDVLSLYCVQSVVWWDQNGAEPVAPGVVTKPAPKDGVPIKMGWQKPLPVENNQMVAMLNGRPSR